MEGQESVSLARQKYNEGLQYKDDDQHVEALKKFDECQNILKSETSNEAVELL